MIVEKLMNWIYGTNIFAIVILLFVVKLVQEYYYIILEYYNIHILKNIIILFYYLTSYAWMYNLYNARISVEGYL